MTPFRCPSREQGCQRIVSGASHPSNIPWLQRGCEIFEACDAIPKAVLSISRTLFVEVIRYTALRQATRRPPSVRYNSGVGRVSCSDSSTTALEVQPGYHHFVRCSFFL